MKGTTLETSSHFGLVRKSVQKHAEALADLIVKQQDLDAQRRGVLSTSKRVLDTRIATVKATSDQADASEQAARTAKAEAEAISDQREERSRLISLLNAQRDLEGQLGAASIAAAQAQAGALTSVDAALADQEMAILRAQATYDEAAAARVQAMAREEALMRNLGTASDALAQREKAIQAEYERKLGLIAQMEEAGVSLEEREAKASAVELEREQQIATIRQENERIHLAMIEARSEAERLAMEDAARAAEEMRERMREVMGMATASVAALGGLAAENSQASEQRAEESAARHEDILTALDEAQNELTTASSTRERDAAEAKIAILQAQAAAEKERQRQAEQAAERAARVARALSMMQIIGSTASAITKEMEKGFPAAIPGMALAAITGGAQLAKAAAQPTSFDVGGIIGRGGMVTSAPDQVPIRALPGEAVLNRSAVSALGERGVERLNRGDSGGGLTVVPVPTYRHFDRFYSAEVRRGGSLSRSIRGSRRIGQREV